MNGDIPSRKIKKIEFYLCKSLKEYSNDAVHDPKIDRLQGKIIICMDNLKECKRTIDDILKHSVDDDKEAVNFCFEGGNDTKDMGDIDVIVDYIKLQMYFLDHPWFNSYSFTIKMDKAISNLEDFVRKNRTHIGLIGNERFSCKKKNPVDLSTDGYKRKLSALQELEMVSYSKFMDDRKAAELNVLVKEEIDETKFFITRCNRKLP